MILLKTERAECHCGNISADVVLSKAISSFIPRSCDCDFCVKHGAAYISDPEGSLTIHIRNSDQVLKYKQGSGIAEFLMCRKCGVLVGVTYSHEKDVMGSLNARTLKNRNELEPPQSVSPKLLSDAEKTNRWEHLWFPSVIIEKTDS